MIIQGIIRLPYTSIKDLSEQCRLKFQTYLINQHNADEKVKTTHCHILIDISGHFANTDALSKWMKGRENGEKLNKQTMNLLTKCQDSKLPYDRLLLARYILKGEQPLQQTGFTEGEVMRLIGSWQLDQDEADPVRNEVSTADPPATKKNVKTQWQLVMEMCEEPYEKFGLPDEGSTEPWRCYMTKRKSQHIPPTWLRDIVIRVCKRNLVMPHSEQVRKYIGAIFNMNDDDVNYKDYEETCIRGFNYRFSEE